MFASFQALFSLLSGPDRGNTPGSALRGQMFFTFLLRNGRFDVLKNMCFLCMPARTPGTLKISRKWEPRAPNISSNGPRKSLVFEVRVGGPVGHPQGVQVKTLIFNIKCPPKSHHVSCVLCFCVCCCFLTLIRSFLLRGLGLQLRPRLGGKAVLGPRRGHFEV